MRALSLSGADLANLSTAILGQGGSFRFEAHGSSMAPFIRDGDLLTVQLVVEVGLQVGDVILYRTDMERLAAHRVVGQRTEGDRLILVARGDAATGPGEEVPAKQVLGRVVQVQRGDRTLDLDRGTRRAAARLWVATAPLGPYLLQGSKRIAWFLARLQGLRP
jgi:hypothetical protein